MSDEASPEHNRVEPAHERSSATSAVAVPLVALGLLAAAVWLGTKPAALQQAQPVVTTGQRTGPIDPLPSWNDGPTKKAILDFVTAVTTE